MSKTLVTVESLTGGGLAYEITKIPGASNFFKGGLVLYQNAAKELFQIPTAKGVINHQTALRMAQIGQKKMQADYAIALTGNAGPKTLDGKEVGLVYIALNETSYEFHFQGSRQEIQIKAIQAAWKILQKAKIL